MQRSVRYLSIATALSLATSAGLTAGQAVAAPSARSTLAGSQPVWANASALRSAAPATDYVNIRVYLGWRNRAAAADIATAVNTPGSASYGKYLSTNDFDKQFAPAQSDVAAVQKFLKDSGFTVVDTAANGRYVAAEGTVAQAQSAFAVTLGEYSAFGQTLRAPEGAVSVPSAIGAAVEAVVGLDDSADLIVADRTTGNGSLKQGGQPTAGFRVGQPCSLWYGEKTVTTSFTAYGSKTKPLAPCGYTPAQVRGLYGLDSVSATGADQTVAFVGANASPTIVQDVTHYSQLHNLPAPSITQLVAPGVYHHAATTRNPVSDFFGEETLDAEAIHTTAPGAQLLYVASANAGQDFDAAINHIVDKHLANILSISYGWTGEALPQGFITALNDTFMQAAATGIGVYVSSGDNGDNATSFNGATAVDFFADSPWVTAVGGTSASIVPTAVAPSAASYAAIDDPASALNQPGWKRSFEVAWQTGRDPISGTLSGAGSTWALTGSLAQPVPGAFFGGGGGGVSRIFAEPSWQSAAIGSYGGRVLPDISAVGDPNTGFLVGQTQTFSDGAYYDEYRIGGTSVSAPLMAGMAAVADEIAGHPLGLLTPRIYAAYSARTGAYYDVDQADLFGTSANSSLPAVVRVNYNDSESAANGLSYSLRTLEEPNQSLHSTRGFDTATGVGTPNGQLFYDAITK
ncbi:MAG: hypothetical protein QOI42_997 [Frankiaceae bacterium]|nr:hypothetical protein [Frankiaceae bacterium]